MLSTFTTGSVSTDEAYKNFVKKLKAEGSREAVLKEIKEACDDCRPSSPLMCVEFCPIWELKRKHRELFKAIENRPSFTKLVNIAKKDVNFKILDILVEEPHSFNELKNELKEEGYCRRWNTDHCIRPLVEAGLAEEKQGFYKITFKGLENYAFTLKNMMKKY
jgi:hypothetical protein